MFHKIPYQTKLCVQYIYAPSKIFLVDKSAEVSSWCQYDLWNMPYRICFIKHVFRYILRNIVRDVVWNMSIKTCFIK